MCSQFPQSAEGANPESLSESLRLPDMPLCTYCWYWYLLVLVFNKKEKKKAVWYACLSLIYALFKVKAIKKLEPCTLHLTVTTAWLAFIDFPTKGPFSPESV